MMRRTARQCLRGMQDLPGVGPHPGTLWMVAFVALGSLVGLEHGAWASVVGASFLLLCFAPIYLSGAYERAELSDMIVRAKKEDTTDA